MANAYKIKQVTLNGSGYFTALRASASTTLVKGIYFSHDDHNTTVTLALTKSGGTTTVLREVTHTADNMTQLLPDTIALESGDQLEVKSTHISSSDVGYMVVNYVESSTSVSAQSIDVLSDVDITTTAPTDGQVLVWNDSANEFRPGDAASGSGTVTSVGITAGTGISSSGGPVTTSGNITVALNADTHDLTDVTSTTPTTGQVLEYNGSYYTPSSKVKTLYDNLKTGSSTTINDGANTNSQMELTATTARLQTGVTEVKMTETSPGEIDFIVAAGAAGSETAFTAVEINGTTTANNALFDVKTGTRLRIESSTNDLATIRNQASADTVIDLPTSTGTLALTSELYTDSDADGQIAAASVTDLSDVTSAGSGAIITSAERTKLTGIATGATANDTDANLKNRANHTGTQTASTISDFNTQADARIAAANVTDLSDVTSAGSGSIITSAERTKLSGISTGAEVNVIDNVVDDTTPQLGGDLDVNGNKITSTSNGDIDIEPNGTGDVLLGNFKFDADQTVGSGQDNYVLTYDNTSGKISLEAASGGGGAVIDALPAEQALWKGSAAVNSSNFYNPPSQTGGWIAWSGLSAYVNVDLDEGSNVNASKQYVVPSDGYYEFNAFVAGQDKASSTSTFKYLTALQVNGTNGAVLTSRMTNELQSGQYDGTGGTCVVELSAGDVVNPQFYLQRVSGSGRFEINYSANYLHFAIRKIYDSTTGSAAGIGDLSDVPSTMGTSGQVLAVNTAGTALEYVNQSGGGSSMWSTNFNGRFEFTTSETGANKWVFGGGYYGVNYYNWTNSHTETLGTDPPTVGTTTFTVSEYNLARYGLICQKAGTLKVKALINWDTVTSGAAGQTMDWLVVNVPSTNMDGTYNGNVEAGICAYGSVTCPSSNANISPSNISITGGSVSAGDVLVLFCRFEDATFTATQRMTCNVSYIVE